MGELIAEIENNFVEYVILRPKNLPSTSKHNNEHLGKICDLRDKELVFDVMQPKSFDLIRGSYGNKLYDISFKLNRVYYQLQHYALEFVLDLNLFHRMIDNKDFECETLNGIRRPDLNANHSK